MIWHPSKRDTESFLKRQVVYVVSPDARDKLDYRQLFKGDGSLNMHALALAAAMVYAEPQPTMALRTAIQQYIFKEYGVFSSNISDAIARNVKTPEGTPPDNAISTIGE